MTFDMMVFDTQKMCLPTKPIFLKILTFWAAIISQQPVELQKTTAPIFGVAHQALFNGQIKIDLRSP